MFMSTSNEYRAFIDTSQLASTQYEISYKVEGTRYAPVMVTTVASLPLSSIKITTLHHDEMKWTEYIHYTDYVLLEEMASKQVLRSLGERNKLT